MRALLGVVEAEHLQDGRAVLVGAARVGLSGIQAVEPVDVRGRVNGVPLARAGALRPLATRGGRFSLQALRASAALLLGLSRKGTTLRLIIPLGRQAILRDAASTQVEQLDGVLAATSGRRRGARPRP